MGDDDQRGGHACVQVKQGPLDRVAGALIKRDTHPGEIFSPPGTEAVPGRDSSELEDL